MNNEKSKIIEYLENEIYQLERQVSIKKDETNFCNENEELMKIIIYTRSKQILSEIEKIKNQINNLK